MPQASLELEEQVSTLLPSAANVFAIAGICSKGLTSQSYTFDPGASDAEISAALGDGKLVEAVATTLRIGRRRVVVFPMASSVDGTISSVTEVRPSNALALLTDLTPTSIAASGSVLEPGPYDSLNVCLLITETGANGVAKMRYSLDHQIKDGELVGTFSGDITVPAAKKAEIVGTIDLSTIASISATLDGLTCIITSDTGGPSTCTFATPANVAAVISQLNTAWSGEATAELVGANKLRILSVTAGSAGSLTLGSGTANSALGLTNGATASGSAATYDIPNTGIRITAATGNFTADDYYTFSTNGPKISAGDISGLFTRVHAKIAAGEPIGAVWIVQDDADPIDARTMLDAFSTALTSSRAAKFYMWGLYQLPVGAVDSEIVTYVGTFVDPYLAVSAGDFRARGGLLTGARFRRPASWVAAWKAARDRFSSDLGNHSDRALTSAFGVTEIGRDERTATTKLATFRTAQTGDGGGFLCLETPSNSVGEAYFYRGRTMAQSGSVLGDLGSTRLLLVSARQAQRSLDLLVNTDPPVRSDGSLVDVDSIRDQIESPLRTVLFDDPEAGQPHASNLSVSDPVYTVGTKTMSVAIEVQRNAQVKAVSAKLGTVDALSVSEEV